MALKDWEEIGNYMWRNKKLNNRHLYMFLNNIKNGRFFFKIEVMEPDNRFLGQKTNIIKNNLTKSQALKFIKEYMKKH